MKTKVKWVLFVLGFAYLSTIVLSCATQSETTRKTGPADNVFTNGKIYTVNEQQPWAESVAVKGNKIAYVGDASGVAAHIGDGTEQINLNGRMLLPGFVSAHDHLIASKWAAYGVDLYSARSKEEYHKLIKEYIEANPDEKVILGIGWNPDIYGSAPTAAELDAIVSDRPALLLEFTIHDAWLNSKALEIGGITRGTPDPVPGVTYWGRDKDGNPTGVGYEIAWMPVYVKIGAWQPQKMIPESYQEHFQAAVEAGMTSFLNPGLVTPKILTAEGMWEDYELIMKMMADLEKKDELLLRTFVQPFFKDPNANPEDFAQKALEYSRRYNSDMLPAVPDRNGHDTAGSDQSRFPALS